MKNSQLIKRNHIAGGYTKVYPIAYIQGITDGVTGEHLTDILQSFNHIYLPYEGSAKDTRTSLPDNYRRQGIWITYNSGDSIITEIYKGTADDLHNDVLFGEDVNWERVPDLRYVQSNASKIPDGAILPEMLSPAILQLLSNGNTIYNVVDDEDLESNECNVIKFKDRVYNKELASGKGYKILRKNWVNGKNILTQDMIKDDNTIYEIRYDFDLNNNTIDIPANCILKFNGGSLSNGEITCSKENIRINADIYQIFYNIKISASLKQDCYFDWFGAKGDGKTDDSDIIKSIFTDILIGGTVRNFVIPAYKYYKITKPIIDNGYSGNININIKGISSDKIGNYSSINQCGFILDISNTDNCLIKGMTVKGTIDGISIIGSTRVSTNNICVFRECNCKINFTNNYIANVQAFLIDSSLQSISRIAYNTFITCYYFSKFISKNTSCVDSFIENNYINGGAELNDNNCFEFGNYNGSFIRNNFIDYYRTIYWPKATKVQSSGCINSTNNHYQVFKYFYINDSNCYNYTLNSTNDIFNWTDSNKLAKLNEYENVTYVGDDDVTYNIPHYIARTHDIINLNIINAILENNCEYDCIFVTGGCHKYDNYCNIDIKTTERNIILGVKYIEGRSLGYDNAGNYPLKDIKFPDKCYKEVQSLPNVTYNINSPNVSGEKILYRGVIYTAKTIKNKADTTNTYIVEWIPDNLHIKDKGTTAERPEFTGNFYAGFAYYDTTIKKQIMWDGNRWVDSMGNPADALTSGTFDQKPLSSTGINVGFQYLATDVRNANAIKGTIIYHKGNDIWIAPDGTPVTSITSLAKDAILFNSVIADVILGASTAGTGTPETVYYSSHLKCFVLKKGNVYYNNFDNVADWNDGTEEFTPKPYADKYYISKNNDRYKWNNTNLVINEE